MAGELLPGENLILKLHQHWIFVAKSLLIPIALLLLVVVADIVLGSTSSSNCPSPVCFVTTCLCSRSGGAVCQALRPASQASEPTSRRPRRALRSSASWVRERAWWERLWLTARERRSTTSIS